ncbi:glycosyltransferase family 2 protein [Psychrobacillus sp. FJAT-51614]|uniref:Glycosyltransferase family 2 protein n=1 Tax=Psychrobacillus mangrovi TaxID=3117745 RepID=A0ABU8F1E4_9BACI
MDVSIIIVNFNTKKLTLECIQSIYNANSLYEIEIILVDNNSSDGSVDIIRKIYPKVNVIENRQNVGFSRANNQAILQSKGRYVLLLNSDTIVMEDTLSKIVEFMDKDKQIGAAGCEVLLKNGTLDRACHRGFPTPEASFYYMTGFAKRYPNSPKYNAYHKSYLNMDEVHEIDCLVGAFMMVRREAIDEIGLLDESFFMYGEDIDWCFRIKKAGWKIYYYPHVSIIHYKGASSRKKPFKIVYEFHRAMFLFHKLHFAKRYNFFINLLVYLGISFKLLISGTVNIFRKGY